MVQDAACLLRSLIPRLPFHTGCQVCGDGPSDEDGISGRQRCLAFLASETRRLMDDAERTSDEVHFTLVTQ